jgi:hypothetical protein
MDNPLQLFRKYVIMIPEEIPDSGADIVPVVVNTTIIFKHDEVTPDERSDSITPDPTVDQG